MDLRIMFAVLALAATYEAAIGLGVIPLGDQPGGGPTGEGAVFLVALLAMLVVGFMLSLAAIDPRTSQGVASDPLVPPIALAAAAFVLARYLTYDPYYLPTLRRMSDGGIIPKWWVGFIVVLALGSAVFTRIEPRAALLGVSAVMFLGAFTALLMEAGH
jgi:hypothetical protein